VTACQDLSGEQSAAAQDPPRRLVLVIDEEAHRLQAMSAAVSRLVPGARILVLDVTARLVLRTEADGDGQAPDVILVWADPDGWAAASVLSAFRPERLLRPVEALLVAEGPLERHPVLVTDFPGLRLVPPDADVATVIARLLRAPGTAG
jgi:hypothetical protein